ncbi:MAG TPA: hypothetical protein VF618_02170 [Thermoanaerobaculia bacterium]
MWKFRLLFPLLIVAAMKLQASSVIPIDVATQVDEADLIFIGTVTGTESVAVRDGSFAYTYVTFAVEETLKGAASGRTLTLRVAGGEAGGYVYSIGGGPVFTKGGRHLLFVLGNDRYGIPLSGGPQGKLDLVRHPRTNALIVVDALGRAIDGLHDHQWVRGGLALDEHGQVRRPQPVAAVLSQDRVTIELDGRDAAPEAVEHAAPAASVLAELRTLIQQRAFTPRFKRGPAVESASPANVPLTDSYPAYAPDASTRLD